MDPLSIATAAGATVKFIYKVLEKTYAFGKDAKAVDQVLSTLRSDLSASMVLLRTITSTLRDPKLLMIAHAEESSASLSMVQATVQECHDTVECIEEIFVGIEGDKASSSYIARSIRQAKFMSKKDTLLQVETRLKAQKANLQLWLQLLNMLLARFPAIILKDQISPQISLIEGMLKKILLDVANKEGRQNMLQLGNSARPNSTLEVQYSVKSACLNSVAVTSQERLSEPDEHIGLETPPTSSEELLEDTASQFIPHCDQANDSDSDEEVETEHLLTTFRRGQDLYDEKSYSRAESVLRSCLNTAAGLRVNHIDAHMIKEIHFKLAKSHHYLEKYDDAEEILRYLTSGDAVSENEILVQLESYLTLAKVFLARRDFDSAIKACREAKLGFKKSEGKTSPSYISSSRLLILIYRLAGDCIADALNREASEVGFREGDVAKSLAQLEEISDLCQADWLRSRRQALIWAASCGYKEAVNVLCWVGVDVNAADEQGSTALMEAASGDFPQIVIYLLEQGADKSKIDASGYTAWDRAAGRPHSECKLLLHDTEKPSSKPLYKRIRASHALFEAAADGDHSAVRRFLDEGVGQDFRDGRKDTALAMATKGNHKSTVELLLKAGFDPNVTVTVGGVRGVTPLMLAAENDYADIAALLVAAGAQLRRKNSEQQTALEIAAAHDSEKYLKFYYSEPAYEDECTKADQKALSAGWGRKAPVR